MRPSRMPSHMTITEHGVDLPRRCRGGGRSAPSANDAGGRPAPESRSIFATTDAGIRRRGPRGRIDDRDERGVGERMRRPAVSPARRGGIVAPTGSHQSIPLRAPQPQAQKSALERSRVRSSAIPSIRAVGPVPVQRPPKVVNYLAIRPGEAHGGLRRRCRARAGKAAAPGRSRGRHGAEMEWLPIWTGDRRC